MKPESKIRDRLETYKENVISINNENGRKLIENKIVELTWVLKNDNE